MKNPAVPLIKIERGIAQRTVASVAMVSGRRAAEALIANIKKRL